MKYLKFYFLLFFFQKANSSLKYYKNYKGESDNEISIFKVEFDRLKSIAQDYTHEKLKIEDFGKYIEIILKQRNNIKIKIKSISF